MLSTVEGSKLPNIPNTYWKAFSILHTWRSPTVRFERLVLPLVRHITLAPRKSGPIHLVEERDP